MVAEKRNVHSEIPDRIICTEVISPKELLLTELDGRREEAEHREEDRHLKEHRKTSSHRADAGLLIEVHHRLLFLHCILLVRILLIELVDLRLDHLHLRRRLV